VRIDTEALTSDLGAGKFDGAHLIAAGDLTVNGRDGWR
jgi:hypothetical protein